MDFKQFTMTESKELDNQDILDHIIQVYRDNKFIVLAIDDKLFYKGKEYYLVEK